MSAGISQDPPRLLCCLVGWVGWTHRTSGADRAHTDVAFKISTLLNHQHETNEADTEHGIRSHQERAAARSPCSSSRGVIGKRRSVPEATNPPPFPFSTDFYLSGPYLHPPRVYPPPPLRVSSVYPKPISPGPGMVAQEAEGSL